MNELLIKDDFKCENKNKYTIYFFHVKINF